MYYKSECDGLNAIIGGNYTYYRDEDGITDVLEDIFYKGKTNRQRNDSQTTFYHEFIAYNEGWEN